MLLSLPPAPFLEADDNAHKEEDLVEKLQRLTESCGRSRESLRELRQGAEKTLRITQACIDALGKI